MTNEEHQLLFTLLAFQECKIVELQHALEKQQPKPIPPKERLAIGIDLAAKYRGLAEQLRLPPIDLGVTNPPGDTASAPEEK